MQIQIYLTDDIIMWNLFWCTEIFIFDGFLSVTPNRKLHIFQNVYNPLWQKPFLCPLVYTVWHLCAMGICLGWAIYWHAMLYYIAEHIFKDYRQTFHTCNCQWQWAYSLTVSEEKFNKKSHIIHVHIYNLIWLLNMTSVKL